MDEPLEVLSSVGRRHPLVAVMPHVTKMIDAFLLLDAGERLQACRVNTGYPAQARVATLQSNLP